MKFTEEDLEKLATLSRITLKEEEKAKMLVDMQSILGFVSEINGVKIEERTPSYELYNVVRDDIVTRESSALTEALLANAPEREGDYVKVTQVLK
jgi:aspartyl-tRNA(Asn)/glutamyl-tRNA(Gln) amidotransferase subunit C